MVSNETRVGYWRTAKTWYFRDVWAYVPEGKDVPGVIAWQPFFSWTTTYDVERCFPPTHHVVSRDVLWFWSWGDSQKQWSIKTGDDRQIATAKSTKDWKWLSPFSIPNGWQTVIESTLTPNTVLATLSQSFSQYYASDSVWAVEVQKPTELEPHVASFIAAASDLHHKKDRDSHHYRRLEGTSEEDDEAAEELEDHNEEKEALEGEVPARKEVV